MKGARALASDHHDERSPASTVDLLVIHHISLPPGRFSGDAIERLFTGTLDSGAHPYFAGLAGLRVSAHFLIRRRGELCQFVGTDRRAWHAGVSQFQGRERCNDFSIGIELEGVDHSPYESTQYAMLARVIAVLCRSYPHLTPDRVVGHCDIAPGRKSDPGPAFDWPRLRSLVQFELEVAPA